MFVMLMMTMSKTGMIKALMLWKFLIRSSANFACCHTLTKMVEFCGGSKKNGLLCERW